MDFGGPSLLPSYSAASVTVWYSTVHLINLNKILVVFDANLEFFPVFQLLMLLWTTVLIALKQEVFRLMVFMLLWHHDDNRNGSLPPWKNSALCPILRVTVCLPVSIFTHTWSTAKVEWDWFLVTLGESLSLTEMSERTVHTTSEHPRNKVLVSVEDLSRSPMFAC